MFVHTHLIIILNFITVYFLLQYIFIRQLFICAVYVSFW